jgi:membrane associated rhomboid family serine protease
MGSRPGYRSYRVSFDFFITPGIKLLLIANAAVFILQALIYNFSGPLAYQRMLMWLGLVPAAVTHGLRIWQPFTYLFLHDVHNFWHIFMNMFMLWMFGRDLEVVWGRTRFLRYYFLTGVSAGLINVLVKTVPVLFGAAPSLIPTIGASGAVFGILIANAVLFPDRRIIMFPIPIQMRMRTFVTIMIALEFFGTIGSGGDNISHVCHLGGILVGYLYLRRDSLLFRVRNGYADWRHRRNRRKFEVYMRERRDEPPSKPDHWVN